MQPTPVMLLTSGIISLAAVIVWLAMYIRKLHNRMLSMTEKFTEATGGLKGSLDALTKSVDKNTDVNDDFHKYILTSTKRI